MALRGHDVGIESNFIQILRFQSENDEKLALWLERKRRDKFTSPQIQNELVKTELMHLLHHCVSHTTGTVPYHSH